MLNFVLLHILGLDLMIIVNFVNFIEVNHILVNYIFIYMILLILMMIFIIYEIINN